MKRSIPENLTGKELFEFLKKNKSLLITEKKSAIKKADAFCIQKLFVNEKGDIVKAYEPIDNTASVIKATTIINTTNWLDSHDDVHIPGLWKKSLSENKELYLLQEHKMTFEGIVTDQVKAYTKKYSWADLGYDAPGITEALVFENTIDNERNVFMFDQYRKGYVKNHSVGMQYVLIELAINESDEYYKEEFAVWNKYINDIANKDEAEAQGYFWAVKEAKAVEGSAVPVGSNRMTPTQSVERVKNNSTEEQPPLGTGKQPQTFDLDAAIKQVKIIV
jgi:hypothetical protein